MQNEAFQLSVFIVPEQSSGELCPGVDARRSAASSYFKAPNLELACPSSMDLFLKRLTTFHYFFFKITLVPCLCS